MTLLGKVFTGLIFVLSIIFFALAVAVNSTHIAQKDIAAANAKLASDAKIKNDQLTAALEETRAALSIEQLARRSALAALQTSIEKMTTDLAAKEAELVRLTAAHTDLVKTEQASQQELAARIADNELLRKQIVEVRDNLNQTLARYVKNKDEFNRLQGMHETLESQLAMLSDSYTAAREKLETLGIKDDTLLDAPPPVNGEVLAVDTSGLVELSLGRDDGIRPGFTVEISRNGQYLGRAKVTTVKDDKSVAEMMTGYQRGYVRQGDRVDSKLF
ncbi:MAG: hypothetical protein KDB22_06860 [Planctomycetales bacterium]|nr:hypothetical protein [Planctomycetales bacterium]